VSLIERFRFMECIIRETPTNRRRTAAKIRDAHTMNVKNALIAKRLPKRACPMNADLTIVSIIIRSNRSISFWTANTSGTPGIRNRYHHQTQFGNPDYPHITP
jgi:hypothetical protein